MGSIAKKYSKYVIVTSDNPRFEKPEDIIDDILKGISDLENVETILNRREAIQKGISLLENDEVLLVLGKGDEKYQIIYDKKFEFDDREIIRKILGDEN
jgi:UDP-N-acetylmuramoyl-L-alanyl-D-glutamate--2,6-diaminopimelate ligase